MLRFVYQIFALKFMRPNDGRWFKKWWHVPGHYHRLLMQVE